MNIQDAISAIQEKRIRITDHADEEAQADTLTFDEIFFSVLQGEVIEDYLQDKFGPSCLVFGMTKSRRPIHIHCSYPSRKVVKIITLYQPDPEQWIDYIVRRK